MAKKTTNLIFPILVIFLILIFSFNYILTGLFVFAARQLTGAPVEISSLKLNVFAQRISIHNFVLDNPAGFPEVTLINIPELTVAIDSGLLLKGSVHIPEVVLNMQEMHLIKNKDGKLNVDSLKFVQKTSQEKPRQQVEQKNISFKIDELKLSIGKVIYSDYSLGAEPKVKTYNIDMKDKKFSNITSPQQLAGLLIVQAMTPTAIRSAAVNAVATLQNLDNVAVDAATGLFKRMKEKLK